MLEQTALPCAGAGEASSLLSPADQRAAPESTLGLIMATHGQTFAFATRFLPAEQRQATTMLYAFFRTLDDLVDERNEQSDVSPIKDELQAWRSWFQRHCQDQAPREPLGHVLGAVVMRYHIPADYFLDFLDGMEADLHPMRMTHFTQLRRYCYQVAATVGLAMAHVLGCRMPAALGAAEELGIAMQLTNILRDVGGDLARGRIYLPEDELARFELGREQLVLLAGMGRPDEAFKRLMRFQIDRAHSYYQRGMSGVLLLPPECRLPILIAARLYRKILDVIERNGYDVLRRRAATSRREKLQEAVIAFMLDRLWQQGERHAPVATVLGRERE